MSQAVGLDSCRGAPHCPLSPISPVPVTARPARGADAKGVAAMLANPGCLRRDLRQALPPTADDVGDGVTGQRAAAPARTLADTVSSCYLHAGVPACTS